MAVFIAEAPIFWTIKGGAQYLCCRKIVVRSVFVCLQCPELSDGWIAGTWIAEGTTPASCIEMHLPFAKAGAKFIEMLLFVCFLCAEWVFFVLKYGWNVGFYSWKMEKNGGFVTEILGWGWGCKKTEKAPCFWLWHALCCACPFMYINGQMSIARGWGLADCSR